MRRRFLPEEQTAFKAAVSAMVKDGTYAALVRNHMDMSHGMHGSMGTTGLYRFLGWHRRYLLAFEAALQKADQVLRPAAKTKLGVPYWRWEDGIPKWMEGFLPAPDPGTKKPVPARKDAAPPDKANKADVGLIVTKFQIQKPNVPQANDYVKFTYGVEGWGLRPDGTSLPAHNHGHAWVGGIMNNTSSSPTDPIFWMHHAEVDRIWQVWRKTNPTVAPPLQGADRIMDPWAESYDDLLDTEKLGYSYDSVEL